MDIIFSMHTPLLKPVFMFQGFSDLDHHLYGIIGSLHFYSTSYYRLVYFVKHNSHLVDSRHYSHLMLTTDLFTWRNMYGMTYRLHTDMTTEMWRYSYASHLHTATEVKYGSHQYSQLIAAIEKAWYSMNLCKHVYNYNYRVWVFILEGAIWLEVTVSWSLKTRHLHVNKRWS